MRTLSLQLIAATALLLCTGCQACYDNFMRFEAWKTERCCNLFHCNHTPAPPVIYAPVAPVQQCPPPVAAAPCPQPAPICAPIQCDPCANSAASQTAAAPCCPQQAAPCCPQPCPQVCCPPVCCVNECCPSPCSSSYGGMSFGGMSGCDSCGTSGGGTIVNETPGYNPNIPTIQNNNSVAPTPAPIR